MNEWICRVVGARVARDFKDELDIFGGAGSGPKSQPGAVDLFGAPDPKPIEATQKQHSEWDEALYSAPASPSQQASSARSATPARPAAPERRRAKPEPRGGRSKLFGDEPAEADAPETRVGGVPMETVLYLSRSRRSMKGAERTRNEMHGFRIGRARDNDLVLPKDTVSAHHAEIEFDRGRYFVRDLNSTNRVYVNGNPIEPGIQSELVDGASLWIADQDFYVFIVEECV